MTMSTLARQHGQPAPTGTQDGAAGADRTLPGTPR